MKQKMLLLVIGILPLPVTSVAHHSLTAEYDVNKPVVLEGVINRIELVNPHSWFYIDVTDEDGTVVTWGVEGASPNSLIRRGLRKDFLKAGTKITVEGFMAKSGKPMVNGGNVTLENGQSIFVRDPRSGR